MVLDRVASTSAAINPTMVISKSKLLILNFMATCEPDNVNDHRAAAIDLQAEKAARPAAPCASYCYHACSVPLSAALPAGIAASLDPEHHLSNQYTVKPTTRAIKYDQNAK